MTQILLIEDEKKLALTLQKGLAEHDYAVDVAYTAEEGWDLIATQEYHIVISDVILPGDSGFELLAKIRAAGHAMPVLLLTALGQMDDKEQGFDAGADDYLTKPFEFRELLLRIKALTRRGGEISTVRTPKFLRYADLEINLDTKELFRSGQLIPVTPREFALIAYLMQNPERVISKTELSEKVWNLHFDTGTNFVEVYVNFLRKKIEKGFDNKLIHTQFKNGYILRSSNAD